jgi:hypothetical protein
VARNGAREGAAGRPKRQRSRGAPVPLGDLEGAEFATCTVTSVGAIEHGAIPVTLRDANGQAFTVDVLRHDASSPGVARGGSLAVYMKVGRRQQPTREEHGLAAMALAAELGRREAAGAAPPALLTLKERAAARKLADAPSRIA